MDQETSLIVFHGKNIRRTWHDEEWYFSVIDIIAVLTESTDPKDYWYRLKKREQESGGVELSTNCRQLKLPSSDGKYYETDCANTESLFRIVQSIPSKKAEPFKRWLAKMGYERVQEIENPELAQMRMKELYRQKGYSEQWIEKRVEREYAILTAEISTATFGMTPSEYKKFKGLQPENLRDHMDDIELILTMLGEATTTRFTKERDSKEFLNLKKDANDGGNVAGSTRKDIEQKLGKSVVSNDNFLERSEQQKRLELQKKER